MFGKKSSSAGKGKSKKSVKQGPKVNFFAAHAEKLVLALVVALLSFLVYEGLGGQTYDQTRAPTQLAEQATSISNNIKSGDPWPGIKGEVVTAQTSYTPKTEAARQPTDEKIYGVFPLGGAGGQPFVKRGDPELLAPIKLVGQSVMGLIAVEADDDYVDPFEDFEDAVRLKGKATGGQSRGNQRANKANMGGYGSEGGSGSGSGAGAGMAGGAGMDAMGGMGMGMGMGGTGMQRFFPSKYNQGYTIGGAAGGMGGMGGYGAMGGMGEMGSGMGAGEMTSGSMAGGMAGGMPGMGGAGAAGTTSGLNGTTRPKPKKYKAETILFNAVTALVPHEAMVKEYEAKLSESASYNAMRDTPIYLNFEIERSEVIPNQPDKWEKRGTAVEQLAMMKKWLPPKPQLIPDVIDPTSRDFALTMPIPPLLMQDYRKFAKHPDIDWVWDAGLNQMNMQMNAQPANQNVPDNSEQLLPGERPMGAMGGAMAGGMGGSMGGYGSEGGMAGGMPGGMGGSMGGYGMEGMAGMGGGMPGGMGSMGYGAEMGMGGGMGGMMEGGSMGGYGGMDAMGGMMGGMGGYGGMGMGFMPAKYKMVRFYDKLELKDIRKTYKYRVRLIMEDPNYPTDYRDGMGGRFEAPPANDLEPKVFARVAERRAIDDPIIEKYRIENRKAILAAQANRTPPKLKFHTRKKLETPWSEPSKGIYVRGTDDVYVHKMSKKQTNPEVEAVLVRLDVTKGAYVPMYFFVEDEEALKTQAEEKDKDAKPPKIAKSTIPPFKRGAVVALGSPLTTQIAHPITNIMKRWIGYEEFSKGWNTVVDVRGGDPLAGNKAQEDPLTDNVEMMMLMSDGRVQISNEFDDAAHYRGFTLADEREAAEKGNAMSGAGAMGGMMGASEGGSSGSGRSGKR